MYGIYVPDADTVRRLIPAVQDLLEWPYCSYLIYLARHVDHEAAAFLDRYARAVHDETGEAIAVIVLFDHIEALAEVRSSKPRDLNASESPQIVEDLRIAYGSYPFPKNGVPTRSSRELRTASPRWSLKFADAIGLSRSFVPCIVAFDNVDDAESQDCVVLDLSNADQVWETLRDAMASFMTVAASQRFVMTAERLRTLSREIEYAGPGRPSYFWLMPTTPSELLTILSQSSHPDRAAVVDMISRSSDDTEAAAPNYFINDVAALKAVINYEACVERLRRNWVNTEFQLGSVPAHVVRRLADALTIVGRNSSAARINQLLRSDVAGRAQFVESVEQEARAELMAITAALKMVRASAEQRWRRFAAEMETVHRKRMNRRAEIEALRSSLVPEPFLPHLSAAIDAASHIPGNTTRGGKLALRKTIVGTTSFGANIAQILQGIGVIR
ncbi:hypothetical protein [Actinokineospora cianjurensis]|uniref:Uncharacterized protein n=1 Tax=Actinokineospora cianjurensis TaxID=585224 RepID=A0A421B221_9PSEU|nr:hypothetical protein [Actinokineospora cianjurensis]RLK58435.1 hypothetical protein CLV68_4537 [Actinokineospora cianjurensis]